MSWLESYWCITAVPEIVRRVAPNSFACWVNGLKRYISPDVQYAFVLGIGIAGFFIAGFVTWRNERRLIGLRARLRGAHFSPLDGLSGSRITMFVDVFNSGSPSVAHEWRLYLGRKFIARSADRTFQSNGDTFDPQKVPIGEGAHVYGTLTFTSAMPQGRLEGSQHRLRLTFQDAARRTLEVTHGL